MTGALVEAESGRVLAARIVRANGPVGRAFGLLGRANLDPGEGMWFDGCASVHTFGMRATIDVVFLDADGVVVGVEARVRPWGAVAARTARDLVELAEGTAERAGIVPGMKLSMQWDSSTPS